MAKVRQPYDEPVIVPWLGNRVVNPGQVVACTDDQLPGFLEAGWTPGDPATKRIVAEAAAAAAAAQAELDAAQAAADASAAQAQKDAAAAAEQGQEG